MTDGEATLQPAGQKQFSNSDVIWYGSTTLLIFLLSFCTIYGSLGGRFLNYDDRKQIVDNEFLISPDSVRCKTSFKAPDVADPVGLAFRIFQESNQKTITPGKNIWDSCGETQRDVVMKAKSKHGQDSNDEELHQTAMAKVLNELLEKPKLFSPEQFNRQNITEEAAELLNIPHDQLTTRQIRRRNLVLMEISFSDHLIKSKEVHPWSHVFVKDYYMQKIPLTHISFRLNLLPFHDEEEVNTPKAASLFRLVNWGIHACSGLLLLCLLHWFGLPRAFACFGALFWSVHPAACETVAWVTERSNCLMMVFGLLAFMTYFKWYHSWKGVLFASIFYIAALYSKPSALGWFPAFIALEMVGGPHKLNPNRLPEHHSDPSTKAKWFGAGICLLPLLAFSLYFTFVGISQASVALKPLPGGSYLFTLFTDLEIFLLYLRNIVFPFSLSAFYAVEDVNSFGDWRIYVYGALLIAIIAGTIRLGGDQKRKVIFGWLWFFGGLGPNLNFVTIPYLMADRYMYLASIGFIFILLVLLQRYWNHIHHTETESSSDNSKEDAQWTRGLIVCGCVCFIVLLGSLSLRRSYIWESDKALFDQAAAAQPDSSMSRVFRGLTYDQLWENLMGENDGQEHVPEGLRLSEIACTEMSLGRSGVDYHRYFNPMNVGYMIAKHKTKLFNLPKNSFLSNNPANVSSELHKLEEAEAELKKWIPTKDNQINDPNRKLPKKYYDSGMRAMKGHAEYQLSTLALIYILQAEIDFLKARGIDQLSASNSPSAKHNFVGKRLNSLQPNQGAEVQMQILAAIKNTEKALQTWPKLDEAHLLQARLFLFADRITTLIYFKKGRKVEFLKESHANFQMALNALRRIGPKSRYRRNARNMLKNLKPPPPIPVSPSK